MLKILRRLLGERSANVTMIVALSAVPLFLGVAIALDITNEVRVKTRLQDATDAASLAVSAAVAKNPNMAEPQLQTLAQNILNADFSQYPATISEFHVCAPIQNDCTSASAGTMKMDTVLLSTSANAPCPMLSIIGGKTCGAQGATLPVAAKNVAVIGLGGTIQLNIAMDSSGSMIVGATDSDVNLIETWVSNHWAQVKPDDINQQADNPPCAFACHDVANATTADMTAGLTNAHAAGATTRYDVMIAAAQQLVTHVQTNAANNNNIAKYTYTFNVYSFDDTLHQYLGSNLSYTNAQTAINSVALGFNTHLSQSVMPSLITKVGANGTGASASSPLKFLILVTDGLESDRNSNWPATSQCKNTDTKWNNYYPLCLGGFAKPIDPSQCAQIKANGVVIGVLETPYVPLTGQTPNEHPYESTVRHVIYPNGPNTASTVSAALQACASSGYYFQATNPDDISTGFTTLTDRFIAAQNRLAS